MLPWYWCIMIMNSLVCYHYSTGVINGPFNVLSNRTSSWSASIVVPENSYTMCLNQMNPESNRILFNSLIFLYSFNQGFLKHKVGAQMAKRQHFQKYFGHTSNGLILSCPTYVRIQIIQAWCALIYGRTVMGVMLFNWIGAGPIWAYNAEILMQTFQFMTWMYQRCKTSPMQIMQLSLKWT